MALLLIGCEKPVSVTPGGRPTSTVLKEVKVLRLQPEGQSPLSAASLNAMLAEWSEVPLSEFYYESEPNGIIFPYQEGELVGGDSKPGTWRFYHCAGLRIQSGDDPVRYFLPVDSTEQRATGPGLK